MVGTTYHYIPERERPDVKVLCGDQVYLVNPWRETTLDWYRALGAPGLFRGMLLKKYEDNWKKVRDEDAGFRQLLYFRERYQNPQLCRGMQQAVERRYAPSRFPRSGGT